MTEQEVIESGELPQLIHLNREGVSFNYQADKHTDGTIEESLIVDGMVLDPANVAEVRAHVLSILQTGKPAEITAH